MKHHMNEVEDFYGNDDFRICKQLQQFVGLWPYVSHWNKISRRFFLIGMVFISLMIPAVSLEFITEN